VTASGDIVNASIFENADLFWAIRGAGANFGIITSAIYQVYDATNGGQVMSANFLFPGSVNRSIWEILKSFDDTLPAQFSLTAFSGYNQTSQQVSFIPHSLVFSNIHLHSFRAKSSLMRFITALKQKVKRTWRTSLL